MSMGVKVAKKAKCARTAVGVFRAVPGNGITVQMRLIACNNPEKNITDVSVENWERVRKLDDYSWYKVQCLLYPTNRNVKRCDDREG